jgi:hypothetical protein
VIGGAVENLTQWMQGAAQSPGNIIKRYPDAI